MKYNAATLGSHLGAGIGNALSRLAESRSREKSRNAEIEQGAQFWERAGLPKEDARAIASQPAEFQKAVLGKIQGLSFGGQQQQPGQAQPQQQDTLSQKFNQHQQQQAQQQQPQQQQQPFEIPQKAQPDVNDILGMLYGGSNRNQNLKQVSPQAQPQGGAMAGLIGNEPQEQPQQPDQEMMRPMTKPAMTKPSLIEPSAEEKELMKGKFTIGGPKEDVIAKQEAALAKQEAALSHKDQSSINKEIYPYINDVQDKAKAAKENNLRLNRMEKLIKKGDLNNPMFASVLKTLKNGTGGSMLFGHIGLDLENLLSADSQEFNKLSADFVKNAKEIFGSRLTDQDLKSFLQTVPTLSQSDEGKRAVIRNLKLMNEADEVRSNTAVKLAKKYGKNLPIDFKTQVEEAAKAELDKIAEKFNESVEEESTSKSIFPNIGIYRKK